MPDVHAIITDKVTDEMYQEGFDILFFNRVPPKNLLSEILKARQQYGFKLVVDLDDHWDLDPHHILYNFYQEGNISNYILCAVVDADAVTVTHDRLAEAVKPFNRNIWVLPNAISRKEEQFRVMHEPGGERTRILWAGGVTHEKDIAILRNPMKRVTADSWLRNQILMVMGGYHDEDVWQRMVSSYSNGLALKLYLVHGKPVAEYYHSYRLGDICLVPLQATKFNAHKSNLKVLEAANMGLPVIVSHVDPYLDFPDELVNYVKSQGDWYRHLRHLVADPEYRRQQGAALREYCREVYNFDRINAIRKELFETLTVPNDKVGDKV